MIEMAAASKNESGDNGTGANQGTSSSKKLFSYGFDAQYVKRFLLLNKILFPRLVSKTVGWLMSLIVFRYFCIDLFTFKQCMYHFDYYIIVMHLLRHSMISVLSRSF